MPQVMANLKQADEQLEPCFLVWDMRAVQIQLMHNKLYRVTIYLMDGTNSH